MSALECVVCGGPISTTRARTTCSKKCYRTKWNRDYYAANKEKSRRKGRDWYNKNRAKIAARLKADRKINPDKYRERMKRWREKHRDAIREKSKAAYAAQTPEQRERRRIRHSLWMTQRAAALSLVRELQSKGLEALL